MANSAIFLLLFHFTDHLRGRLRVIKSLADFAIALTRINKNWNKLVSYESFPHKQQASTLRLNSHRLLHQTQKKRNWNTKVHKLCKIFLPNNSAVVHIFLSLFYVLSHLRHLRKWLIRFKIVVRGFSGKKRIWQEVHFLELPRFNLCENQQWNEKGGALRQVTFSEIVPFQWGLSKTCIIPFS